MNDRAAVKSPENPGFKPKNTAGADLRVGELSWSSTRSTRSRENGCVSTRSTEN
jgi:hypothetical protein